MPRGLEKLQKLPEKTRKIIFWFLMVIVVAFLLFFWINDLKNRIVKINGESIKKEMNFPSFNDIFKKLPQINGQK